MYFLFKNTYFDREENAPMGAFFSISGEYWERVRRGLQVLDWRIRTSGLPAGVSPGALPAKLEPAGRIPSLLEDPLAKGQCDPWGGGWNPWGFPHFSSSPLTFYWIRPPDRIFSDLRARTVDSLANPILNGHHAASRLIFSQILEILTGLRSTLHSQNCDLGPLCSNLEHSLNFTIRSVVKINISVCNIASKWPSKLKHN